MMPRRTVQAEQIDIEATTYGHRLRAARQNRKLSLEDVSRLLVTELPFALTVTAETLRTYETVVPEEKANAVLVAALCNLYNVNIEDISFKLADDLKKVESLIKRAKRGPARSRCSAVPTLVSDVIRPRHFPPIPQNGHR
jgi:transcriptional regulator with XRE-family HTH domain